MEGKINYFLDVPFRSPFGPVKELREYFTNKKVFDLGCGSGDLILYIQKNLEPQSVKGINWFLEKFQRKDNYQLNITHGEIKDIDFQKDDSDTYFMWVETPETEIYVIKQNLNKKCNIIIAYNVRANCSLKPKNKKNFNIECRFCRYLECIDGKVQTLKNFLKENNIKYVEKNIDYNDGTNCRQNGIIKYFII